MAQPAEVEIKFRIENLRAISRRLQDAGFSLVTHRTYEVNTLYDLPDQSLRRKGEILRLRKYGPKWVLTHKSKTIAARHKKRIETETKIEDGAKMDTILRALGFLPAFRYEKFRTEWADDKGHVVIDETPIGNLGEIEGPPRWIDRSARRLGIGPQDYITQSYGDLFMQWKRVTGSTAEEMTFRAVRQRSRKKNSSRANRAFAQDDGY
jgi:adenylate cyclase class 2